MRQQHGFSLMEAFLAIIVVVMAGLGAYTVFDSGTKNEHISEATDEAVQIANVYTDLASSDLTANGDDLPTLLQNSGRLSSKYFSSTDSAVTMYNAFGALTFADVKAYSFSAIFPLGCFTGDVTSESSVPGQFFSKVSDMYSCNPSGGKDYVKDCVPNVTKCASGEQTSITLYFNMNH